MERFECRAIAEIVLGEQLGKNCSTLNYSGSRINAGCREATLIAHGDFGAAPRHKVQIDGTGN